MFFKDVYLIKEVVISENIYTLWKGQKEIKEISITVLENIIKICKSLVNQEEVIIHIENFVILYARDYFTVEISVFVIFVHIYAYITLYFNLVNKAFH